MRTLALCCPARVFDFLQYSSTRQRRLVLYLNNGVNSSGTVNFTRVNLPILDSQLTAVFSPSIAPTAQVRRQAWGRSVPVVTDCVCCGWGLG